MKLHRKYIFAVLGVATFCVVTNSYALTLGRAKGAVLLGQTLTLTVPVQMEMGEGASAQCFEADVFYGESRQDASRIRVTSEVSPQSPTATVTIVARVAVDEPVVTVYLRAICESKATRRYVMLTELATSSVVAPSMFNSPAPVLLAQPRAAVQARSANGPVNSTPSTSKPVKTDKVGARSVPAPEVNTATKPLQSESRRARLKLAPVDLTLDRDPILKLSNELGADGGEDLQKRARAVVLWRSLNATPQDITGAETHRQTLESNLKGLHDITVKNRQMLDELTRRLGKAESERYSNPLVYFLLVAILLCCLVIAFAWNRASRGALAGTPWWRDGSTEKKSEIAGFSTEAAQGQDTNLPVGGGKANAASAEPLSGATGAWSQGVTRVEDIDVVLEDHLDSSLKPAETQAKKSAPAAVPSKPVVAASSGHVDFAHSMSATLRSVNTKEMLDVRQQADFFMTLGQHDEAIALLTDSVDGGADANPLVYLELLRVLHTLGRKVEYDQYCSGFNAIFSGHVPAYADFNKPGSGLEAYPQVCRQIVALWPSEEVVSYMENCLVRRRKEAGGQDFDLEAFRDLLMLHGVANRIASTTFDSGFMAFSTAKTAPAPVGGASKVDFDLDLSGPTDNLIDFDASGWSPSASSGDQQKLR